jgi:Cu(I)/Ag(I) efflux system membrane fusion protein
MKHAMKKNKLYLSIFLFILLDLFSCKQKPSEVADQDYYTCSMDPQVKEKVPGICPICKMELTKVSGNESSSTIMLSEEQIELANIKTEVVDFGNIGEENVITGEIVVNENLQSVITTRIEGRIDKLHFKNVGEQIRVGQVVYEIYSEELATAQRDLLLLTKKEKQLAGLEIDYKQLLEAAKNKLRLWGISDTQIERLITKAQIQIPFPILSNRSGTIIEINTKEGDYVMTGVPLYKVADLSSVWVQAQIYSNEVSEISIGKEVKIRVNEFSNQSFTGKISFINPQLVNKTKIDLIRIEIPNNDGRLRPGMQAFVKVDKNSHQGLTINSNAVLRDSKGARVWRKRSDGSFENVMIFIGLQTSEKVEVLDGLEKGDEIVTSGAYLLNSEFIFKRGASPLEAHDMSKM